MNFLFAFLFPVIAETIPNGPFSYPGNAQAREEILVDPENSPLLDSAYQELQNQLNPFYTERDILQITSHYIRESVFDLNLCTVQEIAALIKDYDPYNPTPAMPLELFLEAKAGLCRHIALTSTYFLNHLIRDGYLNGQAFLIRDNLPDMRHAWTLFLSDEGAAWHLDTFWGILENGKTPDGFARLCKKYGKRAMERQKLRWEPHL